MSLDEKRKENFLKAQIRFRPAEQADVNFIFNSWLKSNRFASNTQGCENPVYFAQQHILVQGLLATCTVTMACNQEDLSQIYGYAVTQNVEGASVVHFVYVKEPYRRLKLATMLLKASEIDPTKPFFTTHRTKVCRRIELYHPAIFNPYLAYSAYEVGKKSQREALENKPRRKRHEAKEIRVPEFKKIQEDYEAYRNTEND